jgi:hypothetical protein
MATKPAIPKFDSPVLDSSGRMTLEWYRFFSQLSHSGTLATSASAAGAVALPANCKGFKTEWLNGSPVLVAVYDPA